MYRLDKLNNCVLHFLDSLSVLSRDTIAICWITVLTIRTDKSLHKVELSGFRQQTPDPVRTPEATQSFQDVLDEMTREGELVIQNDADNPNRS